MGKIEDLLDPDERIVKNKSQVQLSNSVGTPYGTLYLTNKRLVFLVSKGWSLLSPGMGAFSKDLIIPLEEIKSVKKGWPSVMCVEAQKKHEFLIPHLQGNAWVDAVLQSVALSPPPVSAPPEPHEHVEDQRTLRQRPRAAVPGAPAPKYCGKCGTALKAGNRFCVGCGAPAE